MTYETLIGKTNNRPSLVVAMPIRERGGTPSSSTGPAPEGKIVGVGMFAVELSSFSDLVSSISLGRGGSTLIVNDRNILVAHSDPNAGLLTDLSAYPPVQALRAGQSGSFSFTDSKGQRFQAHISLLPNGWGVVAQQTEAGLFGSINQFQQLALVILLVGAIVVSLLTWTTIRQAIHPIQRSDPGGGSDQLGRPDAPGSRAKRSAGQPG